MPLSPSPYYNIYEAEPFLIQESHVGLFKTNGLREVFSQWKLMLSAFLWLLSLSRELRKSQINEKILAPLLCHHGYLVTCSISLCAFSLAGVSGGCEWSWGMGYCDFPAIFSFPGKVRAAWSSKHRASFVVCWLFRASACSPASKHFWVEKYELN